MGDSKFFIFPYCAQISVEFTKSLYHGFWKISVKTTSLIKSVTLKLISRTNSYVYVVQKFRKLHTVLWVQFGKRIFMLLKFCVKSSLANFEFKKLSMWFHVKSYVAERFLNIQCGNYKNSLSRIFGKNFVKVTVLLKKLLNKWFDEIFFRWERISHFSQCDFHTVLQCCQIFFH